MKVTIAIVLAMFFNGQTMNAQDIYFPDINFKNALIAEGVDADNDGEIQIAEVAMITELNLPDRNITDLTGIAYFSNLTQLSCQRNQLISLDLSANINLTRLSCQNNQLSSLNLTNNSNLIELYCQENQLTELDLTNNIDLNYLYCNNNLLTSLDLTNNVYLVELNCIDNLLQNIDLSYNLNLITLFCYDNILTSLDLRYNTNLQDLYCQNNELAQLDLRNGNNVHLASFEAFNNPDLNCILVDDVDLCTNLWSDHIDTHASFIANMSECSRLSVPTNSITNSNPIKIYPNPTTGILNFDFETGHKHSIRIINSLGQLVNTYTTNDRLLQVNLGNTVAAGLYYVQIITDKNQIIDTRKVIVK